MTIHSAATCLGNRVIMVNEMLSIVLNLLLMCFNRIGAKRMNARRAGGRAQNI
jgi:hypothetical protein